MRHYLPVLSYFIVTVAGLAPVSGAIAAERTLRQTLSVNPDVHFSTAIHRGELEIVPGSSDSIEITAVLRHDDASVLDRISLDIADSPSFVSAEIDYDEPDFEISFGFIGFNDYEYPEVRLVVALPPQASLEIDAHRSEMNVEAPTGRLELASHRSYGRIRNVSNDLEIENHRGDLDIEVASLKDIDISSHRGEIRLAIPGASDFTLTGETHRGDLRTTGREISTEVVDRGERVRYVEGNGDNFITFDIERGNLRLDLRD